MTAEVMRKAAALDLIVAKNAAMLMIPNNVYSINVSGQSVSDPHFGMSFWNAIRPSAVEPSALVIEITETAQITDIAAAKAFCDITRDYGARIAIDDVSGADLPLPLEWVDFLKIDGIRLGGLTSRRSGAIIHALMRMADASERIRVVAEGVENAAELESMAIAGVHYWQGHYQDGAAKAIL
jgi:EAL domain-containing protein (putative c-di-GMP-specific phosphodiesterase class I)